MGDKRIVAIAVFVVVTVAIVGDSGGCHGGCGGVW